MRKVFGCLFLSFVIVGTTLAGDTDWTRKSTVRTKCETGRTANTVSYEGGSGTVVAKAADHFDVLSCRHVIEGGDLKTLTITTHDGKTWPAEVVRVSKTHDLSLMRVRTGSADVVAASLAGPGADLSGVRVVKSGYPGWAGGRLDVSEGEMWGEMTREPNEGPWSLAADATSSPGDSGGGLYRKNDHALVGVVWGGLPGQLRAVPTGAIRSFLRGE